jgi:hypothetical protein
MRRKIMKKICLLGLTIMAAMCSNAFAAPIHSYQELTSAMREGNRFVILLDLQQCTGKPGMPTGYFTPTAMMLVPATEKTPERVVTSLLHFTDHSGSPVYEYVKYTLNSDNTVAVRTTFYDPQNFKPIGEARTLQCSLGKGVEVYRK